MPNPIPAEVSEVIDPNISSAADWVNRSAAAKTLLIERHNFKDSDFYEVTEDDDPSLDGWCKYPQAWIKRSGFVAEKAIPRGLVIYCPEGVDYWGEPHDERDPIYLLSDIEFWANMTCDEIAVPCNEHKQDEPENLNP